MRHWKIVLSYDGTPYHGWQIQPSLPTVQGTLSQAIHRISGEHVLPQGSGRTDAGVHALAQVATFPLSAPIPAANFHRALNHALPASIRILTVELVPRHFHARHSALRKTYEYRILPCGRICSPMLAPYVWACGLPIDLGELNRAATHILGTHDFTSFAASDPDLATRTTSKNPATEPDPAQPASSSALDATDDATDEPPPIATATRTIFHSHWSLHSDLLKYTITGSGFLHHMVRNLVGTFVEAGAGRIPPDSIPTILNQRSRSAAGPTAPAQGLFLVDVEY